MRCVLPGNVVVPAGRDAGSGALPGLRGPDGDDQGAEGRRAPLRRHLRLPCRRV